MSEEQDDAKTDVSKGLSIPIAALFIVGEIAGLGILALPRATEDMGWIGLIILVAFAVISTFTGIWLGKTWTVIQARDPSCRGHVPDPYPIIGEKAYGKFGRNMVAVAMDFNQFGGAIVFLLLTAENIQDILMKIFDKNISFCYWLLILAGILCPLIWFGTPKDFGVFGVLASGSGGIACLLLVINMIQDSAKYTDVVHSKLNLRSFALAMGSVAFSLGGHGVFPTIQTDMKKPSDMKWAVVSGYIIVILMYLSVAAGGYFSYGHSINSNILKTIPKGPLSYTAQALFIFHLIFSMIINFNPFLQEMEGRFKIKNVFSFRRCIFRTLMIAIVLFLAESIPHFSAILSLIGGSSTTLVIYIFPSIFYLKICEKDPSTTEREELCKDETEDNNVQLTIQSARQLHIPLWEKVLICEILIVGLVAGVAATVSAVYTITSPDTFTVPCYISTSTSGS